MLVVEFVAGERNENKKVFCSSLFSNFYLHNEEEEEKAHFPSFNGSQRCELVISLRTYEPIWMLIYFHL